MEKPQRWYGTSGNSPCEVMDMTRLREAQAQVAARQAAQAAKPKSVSQALAKALNGEVEGAARATDALYQ